MKKIREYFIAHYFIQFKNNKFLIIEGAFIYMLFACSVLAYGTLEFYNEWLILPFLLPFLFGLYQFAFAPKENLYFLDGHWRTQLRLLKDIKMRYDDKPLERELSRKWYNQYGVMWEDIQAVKLQKWHPLALPIITLIILLLWS